MKNKYNLDVQDTIFDSVENDNYGWSQGDTLPLFNGAHITRVEVATGNDDHASSSDQIEILAKGAKLYTSTSKVPYPNVFKGKGYAGLKDNENRLIFPMRMKPECYVRLHIEVECGGMEVWDIGCHKGEISMVRIKDINKETENEFI